MRIIAFLAKWCLTLLCIRTNNTQVIIILLYATSVPFKRSVSCFTVFSEVTAIAIIAIAIVATIAIATISTYPHGNSGQNDTQQESVDDVGYDQPQGVVGVPLGIVVVIVDCAMVVAL